MVLQDIPWAYSECIDPTSIPVEAGVRTLFIRDVFFDEDSSKYRVDLEDMGNNAVFNVSYWLLTKDGDLNERSVGTLGSLKRALFGPQAVGIPNPITIKGGIVSAEVVIPEANSAGKVYPRIYHFDAVEKDLAELSALKGQYYVGAESDATWYEDADEQAEEVQE